MVGVQPYRRLPTETIGFPRADSNPAPVTQVFSSRTPCHHHHLQTGFRRHIQQKYRNACQNCL